MGNASSSMATDISEAELPDENDLQSSPLERAKNEAIAGQTSFREKDYPKALEHFQAAIAAPEFHQGDAISYALAHNYCAQISILQGDLLKAVDHYEQAVGVKELQEQMPASCAAYHVNCARVLAKLSRTAEEQGNETEALNRRSQAVKHFNQSFAFEERRLQYPLDTARDHSSCASLLEKSERYSEAIEHRREAFKEESYQKEDELDHAYSQADCALDCMQVGDWAGTVEHYRHALSSTAYCQSDVENASRAQAMCGSACEKLGLWQEARVCYARAYRMPPEEREKFGLKNLDQINVLPSPDKDTPPDRILSSLSDRPNHPNLQKFDPEKKKFVTKDDTGESLWNGENKLTFDNTKTFRQPPENNSPTDIHSFLFRHAGSIYRYHNPHVDLAKTYPKLGDGKTAFAFQVANETFSFHESKQRESNQQRQGDRSSPIR